MQNTLPVQNSNYALLPGYRDLRNELISAGLLERKALRYVPYLLLGIVFFAATYFVLTRVPGMLGVVMAAPLLTLSFIQVVFIAHDAGHNQVFRSRLNNRRLLFLTSFVLGTSAMWWLDKHTKHHAAPNHEGIDSDIDIPILAFSEEQAQAKRGLARLIVKQQGWLCIPMMSLEGFWPQLQSAQFLARSRPAGYGLQLGALLAHQVLLSITLTALVGVWPAVALGLMTHALFGIYMTLVFITNHTAMPLSEGAIKLSFIETQLRTTRNVKTNQLGDIVYGGLHYQIEHHLYPYLPRPSLRRASPIIRRYVEAADLPYDECGVREVYGEILGHMRAVGSTI